MAILLAISVLASAVSGAVTATVTLQLHSAWKKHHHVLTPQERFLQHNTFRWSRPEKWAQ